MRGPDAPCTAGMKGPGRDMSGARGLAQQDDAFGIAAETRRVCPKPRDDPADIGAAARPLMLGGEAIGGVDANTAVACEEDRHVVKDEAWERTAFAGDITAAMEIDDDRRLGRVLLRNEDVEAMPRVVAIGDVLIIIDSALWGALLQRRVERVGRFEDLRVEIAAETANLNGDGGLVARHGRTDD